MAFDRMVRGLGVQSFDDLEKDLEIRNEREALAYAEAKLGIELEAFASSTVGRYVVGRAREEIEEFLTWSLSEEATPAQFMERRAKALAARTLVGWLAEQVKDGLTATQQLNQNEQG